MTAGAARHRGAGHAPDPQLRPDLDPTRATYQRRRHVGTRAVDLHESRRRRRRRERQDGGEEGEHEGPRVTSGTTFCLMRAFVGLGSNLGDREANLRRAVEELDRLPATTVRRVSRFRDTAPVGYVDQPRFLNGATELETGLAAPDLLAELLRIERELGRDRSNVPVQGPRTIDLDLLLYGDEQITAPGLEIPHPRLHERAFVLEPLIDLDAGLFVPGKGAVQALLAGLELEA